MDWLLVLVTGCEKVLSWRVHVSMLSARRDSGFRRRKGLGGWGPEIAYNVIRNTVAAV